ncbi:MAG: IS66 family insertion sequence element accessory protein TnpA [Polyangiaceae bacterium]|jgi:hypothetical protein
MTETETKWTERVRAWRASGRTAREFAAGQEFKPSTLTYWASQLRRSASAEGGVAGKRAPRLRMVQVVGTAAMAPREDTLVVAVGTARIVVRAGFDRALLRDVVEALGGTR